MLRDVGGRVHGDSDSEGQISPSTGDGVVEDDGRLLQKVFGVC